MNWNAESGDILWAPHFFLTAKVEFRTQNLEFKMLDKKTLIDWDKRYLWHPFTQMKDWLAEEPIIIERGEGVHLIDTEGNRYIDGIASMWTNVHGHNRKEINDALKAQMDQIAHSTLLGYSNVPAIELAKKLVELTPHGLKKVFYSDNGRYKALAHSPFQKGNGHTLCEIHQLHRCSLHLWYRRDKRYPNARIFYAQFRLYAANIETPSSKQFLPMLCRCPNKILFLIRAV